MDEKKSTHCGFHREIQWKNTYIGTVCDSLWLCDIWCVLLCFTTFDYKKGTTKKYSCPNNGRKTHQRLLVDLTIDDWRICVGLHSTGQPLHKNTQTLATLLQPSMVGLDPIYPRRGLAHHQPCTKKKLDMTCSKQLITDNIPWLRMTPYSSPCEPVSLPADALIELVQTSLTRWNHIYCWFIHPKLDSLNLPRIRLMHLVEHAKSYSTIVGKFSWYFYPKTWTFSHAQPPATSKGGN